jgi:hypothetical protein
MYDTVFRSLQLKPLTMPSKVGRSRPADFVGSPFEPDWLSGSETDTISATDDSGFKNYWQLARPPRSSAGPIGQSSSSPVIPSLHVPRALASSCVRRGPTRGEGAASHDSRIEVTATGTETPSPVGRRKTPEIHNFMIPEVCYWSRQFLMGQRI